jgi:hypothetical protein
VQHQLTVAGSGAALEANSSDMLASPQYSTNFPSSTRNTYDGQVVDLARADRRQRLVESSHAVGDVAREREHDPE